MKRIASRPLRRAVFPVALLSVLAYGSACFHHHDVPAVRPGGHSRHIATRGTLPPDFLDLVTTKKAFADLATVMPNGSPQVTPIWFDFDGKYIRVNSARGRVKDKNMRRDPRVAPSADMARAAGSKCTAAEYNAAGQRAADKAKCFGKAVKKGGGVDSACLSKAEGMFSSLFMKAESHADCLAPKGDAGTVASTVDAFVEDITRTVTGSTGGAFVASKCNAKKIEAVATKVAAKAKCESKAARKGTAVAPRCLTNADGKFGHAIGTAEGKGDCAQKGQRATLEAKVDAFVDALMSQLQPMGTVTTTTTRTARTTTTTASTPRICCHFASGGTCNWAPSANACSGNEVPGTPGASGSVCNGATGT